MAFDAFFTLSAAPPTAFAAMIAGGMAAGVGIGNVPTASPRSSSR
jgi:hypothetical protein